MISILSMFLVLASVDGGSEVILDAPFEDPNAGVYQVNSAVAATDGGVLGPGWWLSTPRMQHVGTRLSNEIAARELAEGRLEAARITLWTAAIRPFLYGLGVGLVIGVPATVFLSNQLSRSRVTAPTTH